MNIMMLGHSNAGKTTFMAALYYRMTNGIYDYKMRYDSWANYWYKHYTLNNSSYTREESEKEGKGLEKICENITKGIYPPPTAIKQEYVFKMRYKNFNEIEFNWFDYRGGALMERSNQNLDKVAVNLISKIKNCDALIVFLDGTQLEGPLKRNERQFRRIVYLIKNAISEKSVEKDRYFPISFIITKDDLCNDVLKSEGYSYFLDNILKDINQNQKVAGIVTWTTVNKENIYNVHWPLFFSIYHCMHTFENEVISNYQWRDSHRGLWESIREWWTDEDRNHTNWVMEKLQESRLALEKMLKEQDNKCFFLI